MNQRTEIDSRDVVVFVRKIFDTSLNELDVIVEKRQPKINWRKLIDGLIKVLEGIRIIIDAFNDDP